MIHTLWYASSNKYERTPLECIKSIYNVEEHPQHSPSIEHEAYYKECFNTGQYTALHQLVLRLDPANGITEVLKNEYLEGPLKQRIVINPKAKSTVVKKKSISQIMAAHAIATPPQPEFWDQPEPSHD